PCARHLERGPGRRRGSRGGAPCRARGAGSCLRLPVASAPPGGRRRRAVEAMGVKPLGRHLLLELFECDAAALSSLTTVKTSMLEAANRARATIVNHVFHEFSPFGVSGVVVIAESHLAIHTWPEYRFAAVDVFSCGEVLQPQLAAEYLA